MMIFSELYGAYYNAVAAILKSACDHPLSPEELRAIVDRTSFGESLLAIEPALREERWPLLRRDGTTPIRRAPTMPLSTLQKRWLKAISLDPRMRLFPDVIPDYPEVEPLFRPEDVCVFDRYADGDPYEDERYIRHFRLILEAIRSKTALSIDLVNNRGRVSRQTMLPQYIEYSQKDDKMRLIGSGCRRGSVINLGRVIRCAPAEASLAHAPDTPKRLIFQTIEMEIWDQRNALERVMMHFAHFEKQAEKLGPGHYRLSLRYEGEDETEILIRVLSFGPLVRVTSPPRMVQQVRERLARQKALGL